MHNYSAREREWLIPVAIFVTVEVALWWIAFLAGRAFAPMVIGYGAVTFLAFALVLGIRLLAWLRHLRTSGTQVPSPFDAGRRHFRRIVAILVGLQILILGSAAFGALKAAMPKAVPFWLDVPLASAERAVFGLHPWQISHALFGWATPALDQLYATFVPVHLIAVLGVLTARPSRLKSRALITLGLAWLTIGIGGAYLLSSAGPVFYDRILGGDTFSDLTHALDAGAPITVKTADLLWHFHSMDVPVIANGISAMPSMHVGLTVWLALVLRHTRWATLTWTYCGLIWLGSVHLGWHYASDGLVAGVAILLLWRFAPLVAWKERSAQAMKRSTCVASSPMCAAIGPERTF